MVELTIMKCKKKSEGAVETQIMKWTEEQRKRDGWMENQNAFFIINYRGRIHGPRRCAWRCSFLDQFIALWPPIPSFMRPIPDPSSVRLIAMKMNTLMINKNYVLDQFSSDFKHFLLLFTWAWLTDQPTKTGRKTDTDKRTEPVMMVLKRVKRAFTALRRTMCMPLPTPPQRLRNHVFFLGV